VVEARPDSPAVEAHRALVLHDRPLVVDLIELTLNHGLFLVRPARNLAEAEAILAAWHPHLAVIDMDHDDSTALLGRLGDSNRLTKRVTPALGLTRRGDLKTKLKAFDLGVDDILTMPFSPEELLARSIVITRRATGSRVVSRDEILDAIWGTDFVAESNIVDRHIRSLRIKLQNDYRHPRFIATVPGRGYRFIPTFMNTGWVGDADPGDTPRP
jgi:DNA-binding response OmpR family regulator